MLVPQKYRSGMRNVGFGTSGSQFRFQGFQVQVLIQGFSIATRCHCCSVNHVDKSGNAIPFCDSTLTGQACGCQVQSYTM